MRHIERSVILRNSVTLLSLKSYFQRNVCSGPKCISGFQFFFFLVGEEYRMFCFYWNIRKSCAVCLPTWPYLVSWCEWCLQKWAHKALARNTCPALFSFGHWSVAWLCRNQVLSTPDKSLLLRSIPDYLNLFLRIFPQCPGVLSLLPWFIQS